MADGGLCSDHIFYSILDRMAVKTRDYGYFLSQFSSGRYRLRFHEQGVRGCQLGVNHISKCGVIRVCEILCLEFLTLGASLYRRNGERGWRDFMAVKCDERALPPFPSVQIGEVG
jgi:hypothetical protein